MKIIGRIFGFLVGILFLIGLGTGASYASTEKAGFSQHMIMFSEDVEKEEIDCFIDEWKARGVRIAKTLPIINGLVILVPDFILISDFAKDSRVERIESDRNLGLSDGLSGHYGSFIEEISITSKDDYPWGILKLFEEPYNPMLFLDEHKSNRVPGLVQLAQHMIKHRRIRIAVFDTGIHPQNNRIRRCLKGGTDLVNNSSVVGKRAFKKIGRASCRERVCHRV